MTEINLKLAPEEARGMIYHLEQIVRTGANVETVRGLGKLKRAVKESEPLFREMEQDEIRTDNQEMD